MGTLLPTKFYFPPAPAAFVARPQLFVILDEALNRRLTLVSAPAGAGKTTLVSAWAQSVRKKGAATCGWLSLDEADNAPGRFWEYLAACLEEGGAGLDSAGNLSESGGQAEGELVPTGLIRGLVNLRNDLILILDDYHLIQNKEIHTALGSLLEHTPPRLHLVLLTRSDPPLELARLRVLGQLAEIRMAQMRFSTQEAAAFLKKSAGVHLAETDVAALNARAEGWVAGLQMAAISLRGRDDASAFVAAFAGSHRFVFDYLLEQVLNQQTPEVREFLLKTSVLERLSASLCDAVAETGGAARKLLNRLERANLFLTPLDDERGWYRYHHLFADLLKLVLEQNHPGLTAELHRRACCWHETQGLLPEALHHALAAGDLALVARIVSANVLALVEHAELMPVLLQMEAAPREERESLPWLGVAHAWGLAYAGQMERANMALSLAEKQEVVLADNERSHLLGHVSAVRAYIEWVNGHQAEATAAAEQAEQCLPRDEFAVRALNLTTLGNALIQNGTNLPRAANELEQAVMLARQAGKSHVFMLAATALAYTYAGLGRLRLAHSVCLEALEIAENYQRQNGQPLPAVASAYAILASILGERGEIEKSIQAARKGLVLSEMWGQADTLMLCLLQLANSLSLARETESAWQVLRRARSIAQKVSPWFVLNVDQLEVRICLDAGDLLQALRVAQAAPGALFGSLEARLLLKQNRLDEVTSLLERVLPEALQSPSLEIMRLEALQALAFYLQGDETRALVALKPALELAQAENRVASFVREGEPMEKLLRLARKKFICPEFTLKLLSAFEAQRKPEPLFAVEPLVEPLSERELEVLKLLNGPLSTPEIAEQLIVSANTVRTHIKSIYSKLGVHGRSGAVKLAKEFGLLG